MPDRKIFYFNNKEVKSAGIIFYTFYKDKGISMLLQNRKNIYSDFGGKSEHSDKSIMHIAARESAEETNSSFVSMQKIKTKEKAIELLPKCINYLLDKLNKAKMNIYLEKSKYMLYFIKLSNKEMNKLIRVSFIDEELIDYEKRTIELLTFYDYIDMYKKNKIHIRLSDKRIYNFLKNENFKH